MLPSKYIEQGWTQDTFARDENDNETPMYSSKATKWCFVSAVKKAYFDSSLTNTQLFKYLQLTEELTETKPDIYNDDPERTQKEVVELMKTIEQKINLL